MLRESLFEGMIGIEAADQSLKNVSTPLQNRSAGIATASRSEELLYAATCRYLSLLSLFDTQPVLRKDTLKVYLRCCTAVLWSFMDA